jgi:GDP-L-fucose synthase
MGRHRIYVAGHTGMVGSAIVRKLTQDDASTNLLTRTRKELDLTDGRAVDRFFATNTPSQVFLAAARVGGIAANDRYPADFISDNLAIQANVIGAAFRHGTGRLLFLGSSCIYPRLAPQPLREEYLLTGPLEPTNRPYAVAKIAGSEMCWSYNRQHGAQFLAVMPTNLYGVGDNYHPDNSHVIPGLLRRFHEAKEQSASYVSVWGTGTPRREFMFADDMAAACVHLMNLPDSTFRPLLAAERNDGVPPVVNIGVGKDVSIAELARIVARTVGYDGRIEYDSSKPDGTPQKLLDSSRLGGLGWRATTTLERGLAVTYADFKARAQRSLHAATHQ